MAAPSQQIRFCTTADGVRIAYTLTGSGLPLVRAPHWLTHLEYDWHTPIWSHWLDELSRDHALLRFEVENRSQAIVRARDAGLGHGRPPPQH